MYLWEDPAWPAFTCNEGELSKLLAQVAREQGRLLGRMDGLGFELRSEAHLLTLTADVVKSSEIEGNITSSKWAKLARSSHDTAHRDILDLVERNVLTQNEGGGRSTSYSLVVPSFPPDLGRY